MKDVSAMEKQFRKKPVVVKAFQWFPHMGEVGGVVYWPPGEIGRKPVIRTIEACQDVTAGDWIITGVQGERYPCKPDIFAETYEPATASAMDNEQIAEQV
ncbi:MAG TPA: hypothetical protein VGP89_18130 [Candidatus Angelobacter sp.]|jgi:hypothetical protein|nr:hypothetical protein [Candidatus Angelobacter sp.]